MKLEHLKAFIWLRWRIFINQLRRSGIANVVILAILAVLGAMFSCGLAIGLFLVGFFALAKVSATAILIVWDGMVIGCLFLWLTGLITELQRSESLSLTKFLHLPVSATGVFLINYLSSFFSVNLLIFVPAMFALALGLALSRGPLMLLQLPLVAAFFFMITALTYQFQGWLAALMVNPRRRRTIVVFLTMGFILLAQLPNLANVIGGPIARRKFDPSSEFNAKQSELQAAFVRKEITQQEWQRRQAELQTEHKERAREANEQLWERADGTARLASLVLPFGWLPLGALGLAEGGILPAFLGMLGLGAIGGVSLWRSYRTTLRLYTGQFTSGKRSSAPAAAPAASVEPAKVALQKTRNPLERKIRWLSEQSTVVAMCSFTSMLRAPESKMMLLSPIILVGVFGSLVATRSAAPPEPVRPLMAFAGVGMIFFTLAQLVGNQFGLDRNGFRVYVLCPAPRREILLGKNVAAAPIVLLLSLLVVVGVQLIYPMPITIFLSLLPQLLSMYLLFCLMANLASILVPLRISPGTMKPVNTKALPILAHIAFIFSLPVVLSLTLIPLGLELILQALGVSELVPVALILATLECAGIAVFYHFALTWEGSLLQWREKKILEAVVLKEE
jgi:hypothetical protein